MHPSVKGRTSIDFFHLNDDIVLSAEVGDIRSHAVRVNLDLIHICQNFDSKA
jgi:hypothetical protein